MPAYAQEVRIKWLSAENYVVSRYNIDLRVMNGNIREFSALLRVLAKRIAVEHGYKVRLAEVETKLSESSLKEKLLHSNCPAVIELQLLRLDNGEPIGSLVLYPMRYGKILFINKIELWIWKT